MTLTPAQTAQRRALRADDGCVTAASSAAATEVHMVFVPESETPHGAIETFFFSTEGPLTLPAEEDPEC